MPGVSYCYVGTIQHSYTPNLLHPTHHDKYIDYLPTCRLSTHSYLYIIYFPTGTRMEDELLRCVLLTHSQERPLADQGL